MQMNLSNINKLLLSIARVVVVAHRCSACDIFINGRRYDGPTDFDDMAATINDLITDSGDS